MCRGKHGFAHFILTTTLLGGYHLNLHSTDEKMEKLRKEPLWSYRVTEPVTGPRQCVSSA